jgi:hypothetical protein
MKQDYSVYPSMIGGQSGIIWSYDDPTVTSSFDENHPLHISAAKCNDSSICLWYVSPLWEFNDSKKTKYALLGEWNKWTAISQQRIESIVTNPEQTQTIISIQGERRETVQFAFYHPAIPTAIVSCEISPGNAEAQLLITESGVYCR